MRIRFPIEANNKAAESRLVRRCGNPQFLAECIWEHNRWRKGEGRYAWSMDPEGSKPPPLSAKALGIVLGMAAITLNNMGARGIRPCR